MRILYQLLRLFAVWLLIAKNGVTAEPVYVLAASSTTTAVETIVDSYSQLARIDVVPIFASSGTLARQILAGAPAAIFISADPRWTRTLDDRGLIIKRHTKNLLHNRLVLVAPINTKIPSLDPLDLSNTESFLDALEAGPLTMGDPSHVPAGMYAKQALQSLQLWSLLKGRVAILANVRVVLAYVERGEAPLGIVYKTDALLSKKIRTVGIIPPETHEAITYPFSIITGNENVETLAFYQFLGSPRSKLIFQNYGFGVE